MNKYKKRKAFAFRLTFIKLFRKKVGELNEILGTEPFTANGIGLTDSANSIEHLFL